MKVIYDDYTAMRDELMARPLNDVIAELTLLRELARVTLGHRPMTTVREVAVAWLNGWGEKT